MKQAELIWLDDLVPENHNYRKFAKIWSFKSVEKRLKKLEKDNSHKGHGLLRIFKCLLEFQEAFPNIHEIIIDATERKSRRPKHSKALKRRYSGKKKSHTRKNTIIVDRHKHIRFISPTREGKKHDLNLLKKEAFCPYIPPDTEVFADKGYTGLQALVSLKVSVYIPKKDRKKTPLTKEERIENQLINSIRIPIEHAIGGMKRFGCMQAPIRNKDWNIENQLPALCAALWNFHLDRS